MRKVFFIGKFNMVYEEINSYLSEYFSVQVCVDNLEMIRGVIRLNRPDIVIISLVGLTEESEEILEEFKENYSKLPVICIGTKDEQQLFSRFLGVEQFTVLTRPIGNEQIFDVIDKILQEKDDSYEGDIERNIEKRNMEFTEVSDKKCIMFVDDDYVQLRMFYELFKKKFDVLAATSAMKALTLIGKRVPDIIFLDYEMPMCDGKMAMQMIRELDEAKDVPVVFITGVRDEEHIRAVLELRPAGYILKPAGENMILSEIEKHVE